MPDDDKAKGAKPEDKDQGDAGDEKSRDEFASEGSKQRLLADLRDARAAAKVNADAAKKLQDIEDAAKSETQKSTDRIAAAEARATEAEHRVLRLEIAVNKNLTPSLAKRLVGTTREELESDADELLAILGGTPKAGEADKGVPDAKKATTTGGTQARPTEKLMPGAVAGAEAVEMDPAKLAAKVPRMYG